jgi:flagellar basal-body rod protein FlgB
MSVADLPLFSVLKSRMRWLEERQKVIAENVANADTPHYRARDLKQLDFNAELNATVQAQAQVQLAATSPGHITAPAGDATTHAQGPRGGFETKPSGNAVVLEEEMMKVAQIQMDHQTAISLYTRGLAMLKTAIGKS